MTEIGDLGQTHQTCGALERVQLASHLNRSGGVVAGLGQQRGETIETRAGLLEEERQQIVEIAPGHGLDARPASHVDIDPERSDDEPRTVLDGGGDGEATIISEQ